jgi:hypothetical protein
LGLIPPTIVTEVTIFHGYVSTINKFFQLDANQPNATGVSHKTMSVLLESLRSALEQAISLRSRLATFAEIDPNRVDPAYPSPPTATHDEPS